MYINQKSFLNMKQINKLLVILLALVTFLLVRPMVITR